MKLTFISRVALVLFGTVVSSCAGYDRALLVTKTNVGLDIDTKPPTAEITIARRELAIQPTFPQTMGKSGSNGNESKETALPLLGAFGLQGNFLNPRITGQFAGGDAAVYLAQESNDPVDSSLCLKEPPVDPRVWFLKAWHSLIGTTLEEYQKDSRPFYFATDTAYGLKVAWSGTAGPYPDSLKLGYNRKEFASPPIFVDKGCSSGTGEVWNVKLPSFYASIDNASGWDDKANESAPIWKGKPNHIQFFATGQAATAFAKRASVRQVAFESMAPDAAKNEAESLNKDLIRDIEKAFAVETDKGKRDAILAEALKLGLVPEGTAADKLSDKLKDNATGINYSVSAKLNELRTVAIGSKALDSK